MRHTAFSFHLTLIVVLVKVILRGPLILDCWRKQK